MRPVSFHLVPTAVKDTLDRITGSRNEVGRSKKKEKYFPLFFLDLLSIHRRRHGILNVDDDESIFIDDSDNIGSGENPDL